MITYEFSSKERSLKEIATLATLSNGFISVRGDPEVSKSEFGTFVSGVYCYTPIFYRELVNLPRITPIYLTIDGEPFRPISGETIIKLDTLNGIVYYESILESSIGKLKYESSRIVHKTFKGIFAEEFRFRPINFAGRVCIRLPIELSVSNKSVPPQVHVKLFKIVESDSSNDSYLHVRTEDEVYDVYFKMFAESNDLQLRPYSDENEIGFLGCIDVDPNQAIKVAKKVIVAKEKSTLNKYSEIAKEKTYQELLETHTTAWQKEWKQIGLVIEGDIDFARYLYFNTFHLLQMYDDESDVFLLPARGLHGYGYRGHVFWDADIYSLPFYLFFKPSAAKAMLKYRCKCLQAAKEYATKSNFKGARFPWESADDGYEATPRIVPLDLTGSKTVLIETGELEQHITADVAYAVDLYYTFTGDEQFMEECGLKIIFETARFWSSRVKYDQEKNAYVIEDVIGPDEYHVHVNNNFYTNLLAKHNLELGVKYFELSRQKNNWRKIADDLTSEEEVQNWRRISQKIYLPCLTNGICEEFEGYLQLPDFKVPEGCIGEKCLPEKIRESIPKTRLIKQADVLAGMFLLKEKFTKEIIEQNFDYYFPRTTHASSLSLPMYAAVLAYLGRTEESFKLLKLAASADLGNLYGNVEDGFHVGSAAGVWTAILFGLAGIHIKNERPTLDPKKISNVKMAFNVTIKGQNVRVEL